MLKLSEKMMFQGNSLVNLYRKMNFRKISLHIYPKVMYSMSWGGY